MVNDITSLDITPNPRILQMLGEIDFQAWQCLAELIDNGFDSFQKAEELDPLWLEHMGMDHFRVSVSLPTRAEIESGQARVLVQDSGPGMTEAELKNAVTAGFSGNDPLGKLGLFGMGFNIATARLGRITRVMTTKRGEANWLVLELDLDHMQSTGSFSAKRSTEEKQDPSVHGTVVEILRIKQEFLGALSSGRGRGSIKQKLSRIYSPILNERPVQLEVAEASIEPWKHCIWDDSRQAVLASGVKSNAYVPIDYRLPDNYFCQVCWHWSDLLSVKDENCPACGAPSSLQKKSRVISGWLAIQRYFDVDHYGIDFVRNGRVIEELNKDCFKWWNPDSEVLETEYPIDAIHWGGRIVGQIHINFAQVDYQKTAFSKDRAEWKQVISYLRGDSPLRPKIAEQGNFGDNDSPLARLYKTFRYGRPPGLRTLVPGGAEKPLQGDNADASSWAQKFRQGDPDYQSDQKWWDRVIAAERARRKDVDGDLDEPEPEHDPDLEDPFSEEEGDQIEQPEPDPYADFEIDTDLSGQYAFPDARTTVGSVDVVVYRDSRDLRRVDLLRLPPLTIDDSGAPRSYRMTYHPRHPAFNEYAETPGDYLLIEIAHWFSTRHGSREWSAGRIYQSLKAEYQRSKKLDLQSLGLESAELLSEIKEHLADQKIARTEASIPADLLAELTADVMNTTGTIDELEELLVSGRWIERASDHHVIGVIQENPELVFDGRFFKTTYNDPRLSGEMKKEVLERMIGVIRDLVMIKKQSDRNSAPDKSLLMRAEAALSYLTKQRA